MQIGRGKVRQNRIVFVSVLLGWQHVSATRNVQPYICNLSTLLVEHFISSIRINRMTTRSRWKFTICTTTNDLTLYSFFSFYIFVNWGWPKVAETCRQPNKTDTKTVVFWRTYPLLIYPCFCIVARNSWRAFSESHGSEEPILKNTALGASAMFLSPEWRHVATCLLRINNCSVSFELQYFLTLSARCNLDGCTVFCVRKTELQ